MKLGDLSHLPPTLTVERAGEILGLSRGLAYEGVREGTIPSIRVGRRVIVPTATLLAMIGVAGTQLDEARDGHPDDGEASSTA